MTWNEVQKEVVLACIEMCDGWSIFDPSGFTDKGAPAELIAAVTVTHKSDGTYKGNIFSSTKGPVATLKGVYGLDLLYSIAWDIAPEVVKNAQSFRGRGFQASCLAEGIRLQLYKEDSCESDSTSATSDTSQDFSGPISA